MATDDGDYLILNRVRHDVSVGGLWERLLNFAPRLASKRYIIDKKYRVIAVICQNLEGAHEGLNGIFLNTIKNVRLFSPFGAFGVRIGEYSKYLTDCQSVTFYER